MEAFRFFIDVILPYPKPERNERISGTPRSVDAAQTRVDSQCIPAVSQWGMVVMGLLTATCGTLMLRRRTVASEHRAQVEDTPRRAR